MNPRNKPTFRRGGLLRVMKHKTNTATSWRRPKGIDSKQRKNLKNKPKRPSTGYGSPAAIRNLHPCGLSGVLVYNLENLKGLDSKKQAVMIASSVGNKKRLLIQVEAKKAGLKILNEKKIEPKKKKPKVKKEVKEEQKPVAKKETKPKKKTVVKAEEKEVKKPEPKKEVKK